MNNYLLELSTDLSIEPVTTDEMKNYLKIDSDVTAENDLIDSMIQTARKVIEKQIGNYFVGEQSVVQKCESDNDKILKIMTNCVSTVSSITYYSDFDSTGDSLTEDTDYRVVGYKLAHSNGYWEKGRPVDSYHIAFTTKTEVPEAIKTAIKRLVAFWYDNRDEYVTSLREGNWSQQFGEIPTFIYQLLMPYHSGIGVI